MSPPVFDLLGALDHTRAVLTTSRSRIRILSWLGPLVLGLCACQTATSDDAKAPPKAADSSRDAPVAPAADKPDGQADPTPANVPAPPGPPVDDVDELKELEGKAEAAVVAQLGEPSNKRSFPMSECCTEFQIELYNTYPPDGDHGEVQIHEWTWGYDGYALTVWFHERDGTWLALDTCRYSDDVEF